METSGSVIFLDENNEEVVKELIRNGSHWRAIK
jgi:hypothetical protein